MTGPDTKRGAINVRAAIATLFLVGLAGIPTRDALATEPWSQKARGVEPWSDADPPDEPTRHELGDFGFRGGAEYRANWLYINPIALNSTTARHASFLEHRLRLDATVDYLKKVSIVASADVLDGVLWGDNGTYGEAPSSNAGTNINAKIPNVTHSCIGLRGDGDPLQASAYGYVPCEQDVLRIRRLYGEVRLPFGVLRVGRQPVNVGTGVQSADGDGRPNRFGFSRGGNYADRILFATKPLEIFKPAAKRNDSASEGLILALGYDRMVTDSPQLFGDDVQQWNTALRFAMPRHKLGRDLFASLYHAYRWDQQFGSRINSIGTRIMSRFGPVHAGLDVATNLGVTSEISQAYATITNDPAVEQTVRQLGARGVLRFDQPMWSAYVEIDYASGDHDPNVRTPLTQFVFAEDTNVGLLLFKHVMAYETGRSSAAGSEALRRLGAKTLPSEAIATRGSFSNAVALFPQVDFHPHRSVLLRGGVLMAWAPTGVVSPVESLQRRDGLTIEDDLVNYVGGRPGSYYGTELDGRVQWRYVDHFAFDLEGAILFPSDALQNEDGYAARSVMVQGRTTFFF
jgi:hypothetical protein